MKKFLKIIGIILGLIAVFTLFCIVFALIDDYVNSKVDKVQTAVQNSPIDRTSTANIELTATPDEFNDYLANDTTIKQIIVMGHRLDNGEIKWDIIYHE